MNFDFSYTSHGLTPPVPSDLPTDSAISRGGDEGTLGSHTVALSTVERQFLLVRGFPDNEIDSAVNALKGQREVNFANVQEELNLNIKPLKKSIRNALKKISKKNKNVATRANFASWLCTQGKSYDRAAIVRRQMHYINLSPTAKHIAALVDRWPEAYHNDACNIKLSWPKLNVNGDIGVYFCDCADYKFSDENYVETCSTPRITYPAFFTLLKDIWFDAFSQNNITHLNRLTHVLVSCIGRVSTQLCTETEPGKKWHNCMGVSQAAEGIDKTQDITTVCFWALMHPPIWREQKRVLFAEMFHRALSKNMARLTPYFYRRRSADEGDVAEARTTASDVNTIAKNIEQQVIPDAAMLAHYLEAIASFIQKYRRPLLFCRDNVTHTELEEIAETNYFDDITGQLIHPVWGTCPKNAQPRREVLDNLKRIFHATEYEQVFQDTPEYRRWMTRIYWQTAINKTITVNRQRKHQAARIIIDDTLRKARAKKLIEERLINLVLKVVNHIRCEKRMARDRVKLNFRRNALEPRTDPEDHGIFFGEDYYRMRKQASRDLHRYKKYAETFLGTEITVMVSRSQIDATLERFQQLPLTEKRYWKMSRAYAEGTLIPELVQDLALSKTAEDSDRLHERQKLFITCKCLTCTICNVDTYHCRCETNVGRWLAGKFSDFVKNSTKARIEKNVSRYVHSHHCREKFDINLTNLRSQTGDVDDNGQPGAARAADTDYFDAHCTSDGVSRNKKHPLRPDMLSRQVARKIWRNTPVVSPKYSETLWAEPAGMNAARHFYRAAGLPDHLVRQRDGGKRWFALHPDRKEDALQLLNNYPQLKPLINGETLAFEPKSYRRIKCRVIYHDLDDFQEHLSKLRPNIRYPKLPLTGNTRGLYLHKTFCLCCRINFGHSKELEAHLQTHNDKMQAVFKEIERLPPKPPTPSPMDDSVQFLRDASNKALAASQLRLYERDMDKQLNKHFWHLKASPSPQCRLTRAKFSDSAQDMSTTLSQASNE